MSCVTTPRRTSAAMPGFSSSFPTTAMRGADLDHVVVATDLLSGAQEAGRRVLVVEDDPHVQATIVADFLAGTDRADTIVTNRPYVGESTGQRNLRFMYKRLMSRDVDFIVNTWVDQIGELAVDGCNVFSRRPVELGEFDTVVLATGNVGRDELSDELGPAAPDLEVHRVGDCLAPRMLDSAVWEGARVGREI